jgi:putative oxidoreductase
MYGDWGLLVLRLAIGIIFLYHGVKKLDGKMGSFMTFIGVCETLGGLGLALGFLTQLAALGIGIIMIGALYKKLFVWKMPFTAMDKTGWELDFILLAVCVLIFIVGDGALGVDAMWWGL